MLIPRPFLDAMALRAFLLWAFVRGVTSAGASMNGTPYPRAALVGPTVFVAVLAVVLFVMWIEMGRRAEHLFLANLGRSFRHVALLVTVECAALEIVVRLTLG